MVIRYIWVSKTEQNGDLQFDALRKADCEKIYHEKGSGRRHRDLNILGWPRNFEEAMS